MKTTITILLVMFLVFDLHAQQWEKLTNNLPTLSAQTMTSCGNDIIGGFNSIYKSGDHGNSWLKVDNREWHILNLAVYGSKIYCCGYGDILISTDSGDTWNFLVENLVQSNIFCVVESGGKIYAGTNDELWVSENNGLNWAKVDLGFSQLYVSSLFEMNGIVFAGTSEGLFITEDSGATWTSHKFGKDYFGVYSMKAKGSDLYLGEAGGVYKLQKINGIWSATFLSMPGVNVMHLAVSGSLIFAGTFADGLFYSKDDGNSWIDLNTGLDYKYVSGLAANNDYVFACTQDPLGGGWTYSLYRMPLTILDVKETNQNSNIAAYPNPAKDILTVSVPEMTGLVNSYTISNENGIKVMDCSSAANNIGELKINVSGLPSGAYFLNIYSGKISSQKKIIILK